VAEELTFTKFTELLLARIHEEERREGSIKHFDASKLMADIAPLVDEQWPLEAVKYLEAEGLVDGILSFGAAGVRLTPHGRVFVERGGDTGLIPHYLQQDQIVLVVGDGNQVAVGHGQTVRQSGEFSKEEALELVDEAEQPAAGF